MKLTGHAEAQRRSRKIGMGEIDRTLLDPERARESLNRDGTSRGSYIFTKHVQLRDEVRRIKVVFSFTTDDDTVVITVGDYMPVDGEKRDIRVDESVLERAARSVL